MNDSMIKNNTHKIGRGEKDDCKKIKSLVSGCSLSYHA